MSEGCGERLTNYADLAGKRIALDIIMAYTGAGFFANLVNVKFKIDNLDVYNCYFSLLGLIPIQVNTIVGVMISMTTLRQVAMLT